MDRGESRPPEQARELATRLRALLRDDLVAVYLHGSFALGCGNPNHSDLDLLVVTRRPLIGRQREAFADLPGGSYDRPGWPRPLELSVVTELQLRPWRHPAPYELHLAQGRVSGPGEDRDLAAHVTVARRAGIALDGPPPDEVLPVVPRADYVDALLYDVDSCLAEGHRQPRYAVLSLARVWASLAQPEVLHTKESGAIWTLARLRDETRRPLELALESYRRHGRDIELAEGELDRYTRRVADAIRTLRP